MIKVREKLYDLRLNMIQKMNDKISGRIKKELFKEMWLQNSERHDELLNVFWNGEMPVDLQWLKRKGIIDMSKKLFCLEQECLVLRHWIILEKKKCIVM